MPIVFFRYFNEFFRDLLRDRKTGEVSVAGTSHAAWSRPSTQVENLYTFGVFLGGFLAGLGAGVSEAILIVTPFEVVKTRLQMQKGFDASKLRYKGPVDCVRKIAAEEGPTVTTCNVHVGISNVACPFEFANVPCVRPSAVGFVEGCDPNDGSTGMESTLLVRKLRFDEEELLWTGT